MIEGVMMRAPHAYAVAVRRPDGQIVSKGERLPVLSEKYPALGLPVLRGAAVLIQSMILGIKALNFSATVAIDEADGEPAAAPEIKARAAAAAGSSVVVSAPPVRVAQEDVKKTSTTTAIGSLVFALVFNVVIFVVLPLLITNALFVYFEGAGMRAHGSGGSWYGDLWAWVSAALDPVRPTVAFNLVDGLIRMVFFLIMITSFSLLKDIRRVFEYHGAEHKVVYTWEAGEELTVDNARRKQRQHPRCGTSFLMVVMMVSIIAFSIVKFDSLLLNLLARVLLIPVIAGMSYEVIRASARSRARWFFSLITRPGLWLQNITTREPDDAQLEVAIFALEQSLKLEPCQDFGARV